MSRVLEELRASTLVRIAECEPANDVLRDICVELEKRLPGTVVGVTMLDRTRQLFEHGIFPSLSEEYAKALKGIAVADKPGSCALAVFKGQTVVCGDVMNDARFSEGWKRLGVEHGLKALVSIPAVGPRGLALGTLVIAHPPSSPLSDDARRLADEIAELCGLVLRYRRNQLRSELLFGELQHRLRNLFSTIGAVVYATLRSHPDTEDFRKTFDGRLQALAKAHSLAINSGEAELRQLIEDTLAPYSFDHDIRIDGPRFILTEEAASALSLATHELATNAAKYGALSVAGGSIEVAWKIERREGEDCFVFNWRETGGPRVNAPSRRGFGHQTLTRSVASAFDASVELDYDHDGFRCEISARLSPRLGEPVDDELHTRAVSSFEAGDLRTEPTAESFSASGSRDERAHPQPTAAVSD